MINIPNKNGGKGQSPTRIIIHAMGEFIHTDEGDYYCAAFLEKIGLSAHRLITPSGDIIKCMEDNRVAYHAKHNNTNTLGVEFLVPGLHDYASFLAAIKKEWLSEAQIVAGLELIREWKGKWPIKDIVRHSDLTESKHDPGDGFQLVSIFG